LYFSGRDPGTLARAFAFTAVFSTFRLLVSAVPDEMRKHPAEGGRIHVGR
jgi:hypothetical protein